MVSRRSFTTVLMALATLAACLPLPASASEKVTVFAAASLKTALDEGRRILHLHFDYIEKTNDGRLLTDEHEEMIRAIRARDVARADRLAHDHSRQFRDRFLDFLRANYTSSIDLSAPPGPSSRR